MWRRALSGVRQDTPAESSARANPAFPLTYWRLLWDCRVLPTGVNGNCKLCISTSWLSPAFGVFSAMTVSLAHSNSIHGDTA